MKKLALILTVVLFSTVFVTPAHSAMKKLAQTGFGFLKVDQSARAAAMGGALMLVGEGADALFYNPAGMAVMPKKVDFFGNMTQWIADISYNSVGVVVNLGTIGTVGISAIMADYGTIEGTRVADTDIGYVDTGNLEVGAYAVGIGYARRLTNKFLVGAHVKYVGQQLGESLMADGTTHDNTVADLAYDFGTIFYPGFQSLRFGMSVRNFSKELKYEQEGFQLPLTFTIGAAMDILDIVGEHGSPLLIAIDAIHPRDYSERIHVGAEYVLMDMIALRGGYKFNYDEEGLTFGVGFNPSVAGIDLKVDYAYSSFGIFDLVNRFSIGLSF